MTKTNRKVEIKVKITVEEKVEREVESEVDLKLDKEVMIIQEARPQKEDNWPVIELLENVDLITA